MRFVIALTVCLVGLVYSQLPHGHELHEINNSIFKYMDTDGDGSIPEREFDVQILQIDSDNDTCVTLQEYQASANPDTPAEVTTKMYQHLDHDSDGCLDVADMDDEFHLIDHNGDNLISRHEFDQYYSHLIGQLFGHGNHGNHGK